MFKRFMLYTHVSKTIFERVLSAETTDDVRHCHRRDQRSNRGCIFCEFGFLRTSKAAFKLGTGRGCSGWIAVYTTAVRR